jgi:drug/metabolite transporter (DMT)-like permease
MVNAVGAVVVALGSLDLIICGNLHAICREWVSVDATVLLHNVAPVFAVFGGWLFLGKKFDFRYPVGMRLVAAGVALISFGDLQTSLDSLYGDSPALLSAVFCGFDYLNREKLRFQYSTMQILFWTCLLSSGCTFVWAMAAHASLGRLGWLCWAWHFCVRWLARDC